MDELTLEDGSPDSDQDDLSDEEDQKTPAEIIEEFECIWRNEKFAPEILPHKIDIVECLLDLASSMEENIDNLSVGDFKRTIYQLEVDRVRYLVTSYLRTRVEKIQAYVSHILKQENHRLSNEMSPYLTESELQFAKEYDENVQSHLNTVTSAINKDLRIKDWFKEDIEPNVHSFIFFKSNKDIDGLEVDDGGREDDVVDAKEGSPMLLSYYSVANLVKKGDVQLI